MSALAGSAFAEAPLRSLRPPPRASVAAPRLSPSAAPVRTAPGIDALIAKAKLGGEVGFVVSDAKTGLVLEARNPGLAMPPASTAKAVTALYGFDSLGMEHRFPTQIMVTGPVSGGKVQGDLILLGTGDPTLDTDALAGMAQQLKGKGITGITGRFQVYASALPYVNAIDSEQPDHVGYNPAIGGMNLNYNRVHFQWTRSGDGYSVAMDGRSDRYRPAVKMAQMQVVNRELPTYTYKSGSGGVDEWTVAQGALGNGGSRWLPVRRPDLYAGEVFQALARVHGITLPSPQALQGKPRGTAIVQHNSGTLSAITRSMLRWSTNLTAEVIGMSATRARGQNAASLSSSAQAMNAWMKAGLGAKSANFKDHSGLSDKSRISAEDMVAMLVKMGPGGPLHSHMKTVAVQDGDGKSNPNATHKIEAKTGTLNFVSSLAGYVTAPDGNVLAFTIFTGDVARRNAIARADRERPAGAKAWGGRSRWLQHQLINRWVAVYGA
ncbi:D-alanyl-D-alanine carboxypeptidase/D-alanyl-D-alanine-endopeptidase [Maritimibacter dapengensis]|nr:D-alanyl-D-alanine carboxypeptidase/D-alanyl-D-alanine-endopeptidase [Maritimibacter dapengensis]